MLPPHHKKFEITFANAQHATAIIVPTTTTAAEIVRLLDLKPGPALFISGGAGGMSAGDVALTTEIIGAIARLAQDRGLTVIDGGTESGVMQMMGDAHRRLGCTFPLIGVAPRSRVAYPGFENPGADAELEDTHTHFVLVDAPDWGDESELLINMARAVASGRNDKAIGVLINGGKIASKDIHYAVSNAVPIIVLEGSGRFADEVATAFKTGNAKQSILRAILAGGDIQLVATTDGPEAMRARLEARF